MSDISSTYQASTGVASGVTGPGASTDGDIAYWSGTGGDTLADASPAAVIDGHLVSRHSMLTAATMTDNGSGILHHAVNKYSWTNAMVAGLGAVTSGNVKVCTLPAKTVVKRCYIVITGSGAGTTTLTASLGRTGTDYDDYLKAGDAQAAPNTIYGDDTGDIGTKFTGHDMPSYTATTDIYVQFKSSGGNLSAVTDSTGVVLLETSTHI